MPDEIIVREGDPGDELHLILSGTVRVLAELDLEQGRHVRTGFFELGAGEAVGELALFDKQPRSASVVAITDCEIATITGDAFWNFLDAHPEVGYRVLRDIVTLLTKRVRTTNRKLCSVFAWGLKMRGIDEHL